MRAGELLRVADGVVLLPGADAQALDVLAGLGPEFTLSEARQALDTSRRVAVPLLELLARTGRTARTPTATTASPRSPARPDFRTLRITSHPVDGVRGAERVRSAGQRAFGDVSGHRQGGGHSAARSRTAAMCSATPRRDRPIDPPRGPQGTP